MAFMNFLDHKCDIYHLRSTQESPGFGLPSAPAHNYPETPDLAGVSCRFHNKTGSRNIVQNEPQANYDGRVKLSYPFDVNIRLNDKIVNLETGDEYTAGKPMRVRDHHRYVMLRRTTTQGYIGDV